MSGSVECVKTGLIYRNPKPHVHSIHGTFPSVCQLANGEMLATVALGEAFEAVNVNTNILRSTDNGETWQLEGPVYPGTKDRITSNTSRITAMPNGEVVVFMCRDDRTERPEDGASNPENLGHLQTEFLIFRSSEEGRNWRGPEAIEEPLVGPSFEICCPITPLKDGRWLLPTSTWRGWNGDCPNGLMMVAFVSHDRGKSWPEYMQVMRDPAQNIWYWESKIVECADGRLLAIAWAYDEAEKKDRPNQYALSSDGGKTWSQPASTGLLGQTATPFVLEDDRILTVYRRMDKTGLWANLSHLEGDEWVNDSCIPLWGAKVSGLTSTSEAMADNFAVLRFGAPCIMRLQDGTIYVAFWCFEDMISVIRWFKLNIN